jgi:hypothetical protein
MRDYLLDLVEHSHDLGCIQLIKITGSNTETTIIGLAEDKSVVLDAKFHKPVAQFISIMNLTGDKTVRISDHGAAKITVDSGIAVYNYILPAQSK